MLTSPGQHHWLWPVPMPAPGLLEDCLPLLMPRHVFGVTCRQCAASCFRTPNPFGRQACSKRALRIPCPF